MRGFGRRPSAASVRCAARNHPDVAEELPLIHTSRCENLEKIIESDALLPHRCSIFDEYLVYLFYGRPAYRPCDELLPDETLPLCPVCFVFKPGTLSRQIARVYPCDSGALHQDRFSPILCAADAAAVELDPSIKSVVRYVDLFFASNSDYYLGRARDLLPRVLDDAGQRLHKLLRSRRSPDYDDRRSAIEVQVRKAVRLKDNLLFVALPREYLDDPAIHHAIFQVWKCDAIPYETVNGDSPAAYYSVIRQELFERFRRSTRI